MDEKTAALTVGLIVVGLFLGLSYYLGNDLVEHGLSFNSKTFGREVIDGIQESLRTGRPVTKIVHLSNEMVVYSRSITRELFPERAYYALEYEEKRDVSIVYRCNSATCDAFSDHLQITRPGSYSVTSQCAPSLGGATCTVSISDDSEGGSLFSTSVHLAENARSPLERQLLTFMEPKLENLLETGTTLKEKNPVEIGASFWAGVPQTQIVNEITLLADLGVILSLTGDSSYYYYDAAQKYGLKYPDGSETAEEFVANIRTNPSKSVKIPQANCLVELDRTPGWVKSAIVKLTSKLSAIPLCTLENRLEGMRENRFSWSSELYTFPPSELERDKVHRALVIFELERQFQSISGNGGQDSFPLVAAENQIAWLNATGNTSVTERIRFYRNSTTDFSPLNRIPGYGGFSLGEIYSLPVSYSNGKLTVGTNVDLILKTERTCNPECRYTTILSSISS